MRDRQLEDCREDDPQKIWDVYQRNPFCMGIDRDHRPDKRSEDEQNINRCEEIILEPELDGRKGEIENEVQDKRQKDEKSYPALEIQIAGRAERNGNDCV